MNPFDAHPKFILQDNRTHRVNNPITSEVLVKKHKAIIPPELVRNKTILDLGSCIGATGNWCLYYGATSYTGVEVQSRYADISRELLTPYEHRATIVNSSIESFLKAQETQYDIVLIMAVLHVFIDFHKIISDACKLSKQTVIIENLCPQALGSIVQYTNDSRINLAGSNSSLAGIGVQISPLALDSILSSLSFSKAPQINVAPITQSVDVYNDNSLPESRYIAKYYRANTSKTILSEDLATTVSGKRIPWIQKDEAWSFNKKVADNFDCIAQTNIPNYHQVINKCVQVASKTCKFTDKIIDVGSALGFTLQKFHTAGFNNIIGVEASADMIKKSWRNGNVSIIESDSFPTQHAPFQFIIANWVLHFMPDRKSYINNIFDCLSDKGILILSEKIQGSCLINDLYYDFKRYNGIQEDEILAKKNALAGILNTKSLQWYIETLKSVGFESIEVIDASFSFVTLMAEKRKL